MQSVIPQTDMNEVESKTDERERERVTNYPRGKSTNTNIEMTRNYHNQ